MAQRKLRFLRNQSSLGNCFPQGEKRLFGNLALEQVPGELFDLAESLSVILPWGSLLKAVAQPNLQLLTKLSAICKPYGRLTVIFGYGCQDQSMVKSLDLPSRWAMKLGYSGNERTFIRVEGIRIR